MAEKKVRQTDRQNDKQTNKQTDKRNKKTIAPDRVGDYKKTIAPDRVGDYNKSGIHTSETCMRKTCMYTAEITGFPS